MRDLSSQQNLYHIATELGWFFTTGIGRGINMILGREEFKVNQDILNEGYHRHHTRQERQRHFGRNTFKTRTYYHGRRPVFP